MKRLFGTNYGPQDIFNSLIDICVDEKVINSKVENAIHKIENDLHKVLDINKDRQLDVIFSHKSHLLFNIDVERARSCTLCKRKFRAGDIADIITCGHTFHKSCLDKWLDINMSCPNCESTYEGTIEKDLISSTESKSLNENNYNKKKRKRKKTIKVDTELLNKLSLSKLMHLLGEFNIDYSECLDRNDLFSLVRNDIFMENNEVEDIREYLHTYNVITAPDTKKRKLLQIVAAIKLTERIFF